MYLTELVPEILILLDDILVLFLVEIQLLQEGFLHPLLLNNKLLVVTQFVL